MICHCLWSVSLSATIYTSTLVSEIPIPVGCMQYAKFCCLKPPHVNPISPAKTSCAFIPSPFNRSGAPNEGVGGWDINSSALTSSTDSKPAQGIIYGELRPCFSGFQGPNSAQEREKCKLKGSHIFWQGFPKEMCIWVYVCMYLLTCPSMPNHVYM